MLAVKKMTVAATPNAKGIMGAFADRMDSAAFSSWISPLSVSCANGVCEMRAANQFSVDFIKSSYANIIADVAAEFNVRIDVTVGAAAAAPAMNDNVTAKKFSAEASESPAVGFDSFVNSTDNAFAITAAQKVCAGAVTFSPLFIYGGHGCGKSMLANIMHSQSRGRTLLLTGDKFVSQFLRAISEHSVFSFKDYIRKFDTVIIDDVQSIAGKRACSDEFITTLSDLMAAKKNVVLFANAAPATLSGFDRRIQSVLASGLVIDMAAPDANTRKTMLTRAGVANDVAASIAGRLPSDGHIVAGVVKKIAAWNEMMGAEINADTANRILADLLPREKTPVAMVKSMCEKIGVAYENIMSNSRARAVVRARQIMMAALKSATKLSLAEIGRYLGGRDHATVVYALAQIEKMKSSDLILSAELNEMIEICK